MGPEVSDSVEANISSSASRYSSNGEKKPENSKSTMPDTHIREVSVPSRRETSILRSDKSPWVNTLEESFDSLNKASSCRVSLRNCRSEGSWSVD